MPTHREPMATRREYLMAMSQTVFDQAAGYDSVLAELRQIAESYPHLRESLDATAEEFEGARACLARASAGLAKAGLIAGGDAPLNHDEIARTETAEKRRLS